MSYQKVYMNQIYSSSIMRQVAQMWKNQLLCDAVIKTGNIQTKAHRLVLIAACPMLQDRENASVGSHLEVRLNSEISQAAVNTFLQYLYEGYMMLTEENCREVEKIAKMLHVDSVTKCCSDFQKCMNAKIGYSSYQGLNFDLQDSVDLRFVYTTDLQKMAPDSQSKRQFDDVNMPGPASKRPRSQHFSSLAPQRPDDHMSMNDSYSRSHDRAAARGQNEGVIDISEESVELVNVGPAARDPDGWPINTDLPPMKTSSSVSVAHQHGGNTDIQIIDVQSIRGDQQKMFGRMEDSRSDTLGAGSGTSSGIPERPVTALSQIPSTVRHMEDSNKYMPSTTARENILRSSPLSSSPPKSVQKQRVGAEDINRSFALGSAASDLGPFSIPSSSNYKSTDIVHNVYAETPNSDTNSTNRVSSNKSTEEQRPATSPEPIIVKLEDETTESESIELYIQNPSNDSYSQDPGDSLGELDPDLSNDDSMSMEHGQPNSTMDDQSQDPAYRSTRCTTQLKRKEGEQTYKQTCESKGHKRSYIDADYEIRKLSSCMNGLNNRFSQLCESSASIQYMVEELVDSSNTIEKLLINMTPGLSDEPEMEGEEALVLVNETATKESTTNDSVSLGKELTRENRKTTPTEMESFIAMAAESCKVQAATKTKDSFSDIPKTYRISYATLRELKAGSKNAAVFAGNIIKKLFPELFGPSGLRFKYSFFGGGKLKKNELDRQRKSYMRRYITAMYPEISSEGDWKDIVNRVNEILRRPAQSVPRNAKGSAEKDNE